MRRENIDYTEAKTEADTLLKKAVAKFIGISTELTSGTSSLI